MIKISDNKNINKINISSKNTTTQLIKNYSSLSKNLPKINLNQTKSEVKKEKGISITNKNSNATISINSHKKTKQVNPSTTSIKLVRKPVKNNPNVKVSNNPIKNKTIIHPDNGKNIHKKVKEQNLLKKLLKEETKVLKEEGKTKKVSKHIILSNTNINSEKTIEDIDIVKSLIKDINNLNLKNEHINKDKNVIIVGKNGGNYTNVNDAINSIEDARHNNVYLILVMPGSYLGFETKSYVKVSGLSKEQCIFKSKLILAGENSSISNCSIKFNGGDNAIEITDYGSDKIISNVNIEIISEDKDAIGIKSYGYNTYIEYVEIVCAIGSFKSKCIGLDIVKGEQTINNCSIIVKCDDDNSLNEDKELQITGLNIFVDDCNIQNTIVETIGETFKQNTKGFVYGLNVNASCTFKNCTFTHPNIPFYRGVNNNNKNNKYPNCYSDSWYNINIENIGFNNIYKKSLDTNIELFSNNEYLPTDIFVKLKTKGNAILISFMTKLKSLQEYSNNLYFTIYRCNDKDEINIGPEKKVTDINSILTFSFVDIPQPDNYTYKVYYKYIEEAQGDNKINMIGNVHFPRTLTIVELK